MNIGLIAHDNRKTLMQNLCVAYHHILLKHKLLATGTTGQRIEAVTNLPIQKLLSGSFGEQQLCAQIDNNHIDMVIFLTVSPLLRRQRKGAAGFISLQLCLLWLQ